MTGQSTCNVSKLNKNLFQLLYYEYQFFAIITKSLSGRIIDIETRAEKAGGVLCFESFKELRF